MGSKVEIASMLDRFRPEFEVEASSLEERSRFSPDGLAESFGWTIHLW
jgi:hypothetical protein